MAISPYLNGIRSKVGTALLLMPSVTGIVWDAMGRLLVVRHRVGGPWSLPGGIVDPGEVPAQALVREVWEESGVIAWPKRIIGVFGGPEGFRRKYPNGDEVEFVDTVFECNAVAGRLGGRDGETIEVCYMTRAELAEIALAYPVPLNVLLASLVQPIFKWDPVWAERLPLD